MIMQKYGYFGVFLLILIENIFPPIPSEVILLFGGFLTKYSNLNIILMIIASTLGSLIGAIVLYYVGYLLNKDKLRKIARSKVGKIINLKEEDIDSSDKWFNEKGKKSVFLCRFVPIVRSLISIPAGMNKMNMLEFTIYTTLGSIIWNTILLTLGHILGANWQTLLIFFNKYSSIVRILLVILITIFIFKIWKNKSTKK